MFNKRIREFFAKMGFDVNHLKGYLLAFSYFTVKDILSGFMQNLDYINDENVNNQTANEFLVIQKSKVDDLYKVNRRAVLKDSVEGAISAWSSIDKLHDTFETISKIKFEGETGKEVYDYYRHSGYDVKSQLEEILNSIEFEIKNNQKYIYADIIMHEEA